MATINITKTWNGLASDYCFESFTKLGEDILNASGLTLDADFTFVNRGSTAPTGANQAYLWFNTEDQRLYEYIGGVWRSRHPVPVSSSERRLWVGSEAELWSYDGGDGTNPSVAGNVTAITGSFWEVDTNFAARFPLGPGTLASGTVINVTDTGGEEKHELTLTEIPYHRHGTESILKQGTAVDLDAGASYAVPEIASDLYAGGDPSDSNNTVPHNNMPPYYGAFFIKRTARVYYVSGGIGGATSAGNGVYFGTGAPAFTPTEGYGIYVDTTTRDVYIWSTISNSWSL